MGHNDALMAAVGRAARAAWAAWACLGCLGMPGQSERAVWAMFTQTLSPIRLCRRLLASLSCLLFLKKTQCGLTVFLEVTLV